MKTLGFAAALVALVAPAFADEVRHYDAKGSDTFAEAVENFNDYNALMAEVLATEPLTVNEMERVHELTYTIEVALAKMLETLGALPETLEEVHLASEADDPAALRAVADAYLSVAQELQ